MCNCIDEDVFHEYVTDTMDQILDQVDSMIDDETNYTKQKETQYTEFIKFNKQLWR